MSRYLERSNRSSRQEAEISLLPPPEAPGNAAPEGPFTVREIMETFRHRWLTILLVLCAVAGPGIWWARQDVPLYQASATIRLRDAQREMTGGLTGIGLGDVSGGVDPVRSQIEVLTSRGVAAEVVDSTPELRIETVNFPDSYISYIHFAPEVQSDSVLLNFNWNGYTASSRVGTSFAHYGDTVNVSGMKLVIRNRPGSPGVLLVQSAESAIDQLMMNLEVKPRQLTDVIDVTYTDPDRNRARRIVNRVVGVYQAASAAAAQRQSVLRRTFLENQLRYHDSVLNAARVQVSLFRGRQRALSTKAKLSSEQESLGQLQVQRENLAADRRIYQNLLTELRGKSPTDHQVGAIMSAPGITNNPVVADLYQQLTRYQITRDSLTTGRFGRPETNPEVQQVDLLIASAKSRLVGAVGTQISTLDSRIESLDQLRAQSSSSFPELTATEEQEAGLEEQVEAARVTVGQLREEYEKARLAEAVEVGQVEIVSPAALPKRPVGVGPARMMIFFTLLGLVLGLGTALLLERLNTSVRRRGQVGKMLNVSELAVIPPIPRRRRVSSKQRSRQASLALRNGDDKPVRLERLGDGLVVASDVHSIAAEAYRLLRTNLLFSLRNGSPRTVLVTSPAPGDGKTTVAANLAIAFAHQGMRVLLVDADMRRGRMHELFRISRDPGLSQVLMGEFALDGVVRPSPVTNLFTVSTGRLPDAPAELVGGASMRSFLDQATREFGMVVIDSPPVLAASDAAVLASLADATVMVVRAGRSHEEEVQATMEQLLSVGGKVVGAVLNDPEATVRAYGGYYYSKYYGKEN
ncbi:MAG TPA: polysaccharide biosynthesis tyrosine autokinase [Gemmatimonadales bacterium]